MARRKKFAINPVALIVTPRDNINNYLTGNRIVISFLIASFLYSSSLVGAGLPITRAGYRYLN